MTTAISSCSAAGSSSATPIRHGLIGSRLTMLVGGYVAARGLGEVLGARQGYELPSGDTVMADLGYVARDRWTEAKPVPGLFLTVVPDLVVEIASESTASRDRGEKKAIYERNGVREYWLVDWRSREVTVFSLVDGRFDEGRVYGESDRVLSLVLAGFEIAVADLLGP